MKNNENAFEQWKADFLIQQFEQWKNDYLKFQISELQKERADLWREIAEKNHVFGIEERKRWYGQLKVII